jgi:cytochrome c
MKTPILTALSILALASTAAPAMAAGDPALGQTVFKKCMACHAAGPGATNRVGPVLNDVVGRTAGTFAGYSYSPAMLAAGQGGLVWTPENITTFLHKPSDFVKGTKMTFPGLPQQADIDNVVAYLITLSPNYQPAAAAPAAPAPGANTMAPAAPAQ